MNDDQLAAHLGGGDAEKGKKQRDFYIQKCIEEYPRLIVFNQMTGVDNYIFLEQLLQENTGSRSEDITSKELTVNLWQETKNNEKYIAVIKFIVFVLPDHFICF